MVAAQIAVGTQSAEPTADTMRLLDTAAMAAAVAALGHAEDWRRRAAAHTAATA